MAKGKISKDAAGLMKSLEAASKPVLKVSATLAESANRVTAHVLVVHKLTKAVQASPEPKIMDRLAKSLQTLTDEIELMHKHSKQIKAEGERIGGLVKSTPLKMGGKVDIGWLVEEGTR